MTYAEKVAKKNKLPYTIVDTIYIGDFGTKLQTTGNGTFRISSPNSTFDVDRSGNVNISGSTSVKISGKNIDFSELPDRYIRPSGVPWTWIANNTEVVGALPIRIKGHKVYIPFMDLNVED